MVRRHGWGGGRHGRCASVARVRARLGVAEAAACGACGRVGPRWARLIKLIDSPPQLVRHALVAHEIVDRVELPPVNLGGRVHVGEGGSRGRHHHRCAWEARTAQAQSTRRRDKKVIEEQEGINVGESAQMSGRGIKRTPNGVEERERMACARQHHPGVPLLEVVRGGMCAWVAVCVRCEVSAARAGPWALCERGRGRGASGGVGWGE